MTGSEVTGLEIYRSRSSTYNETLWVTLNHVMPLKPSSARSQMARGSIAMANRSGDRGQPCLVPLQSEKGGYNMPLVWTDAVGDEYNNLTHRIKFPPRPNLSIASYRYPHSTLSNAFSASRDTTISGISLFDEWTMSSSRLVLWKDCRPSINPVWSSEIMEGINRWRRSARTFART